MNAPLIAMTSPHPARFTVDEFIRLEETGVFDKYSKTELIEGEITCMNSQWSPHARAKTELAFELGLKLREIGSTLRPLIEVSVRLDDESLPEPDIALTNYRGKGAVPVATVALVVEVSDTTLDTDVGRKADLYARAGIAEYWVIDVEGQRAVLHSLPGVDGYAEHIDVPFGDMLHSATIEGLSVPTNGLSS